MKRRTRFLKSLLLMPLAVLIAGAPGALAKITTTSADLTLLNKAKNQPWALTFVAESERGLGYQQDTWDLNTGLALIRIFKSGNVASAGLGFRSILYREYNGKTFDTQDARPEYYGLTDLTFGFTMPKLYEAEPVNLSSNLKLTLPTSTISRDASLIAALDGNLNFDIVVTDWFSVSPTVGGALRQYRYDDADEAGTKINSPFALSYGMGIAAGLVEGVILSSTYLQTQRLDYQGSWQLIQTANALLQYKVNDNFEVQSGYLWKDKTLSNEPALAYDNSSITVGLKATIQ